MKKLKLVKIVIISNIRPDALELRVTKSFMWNGEWGEKQTEIGEIMTN